MMCKEGDAQNFQAAEEHARIALRCLDSSSAVSTRAAAQLVLGTALSSKKARRLEALESFNIGIATATELLLQDDLNDGYSLSASDASILRDIRGSAHYNRASCLREGGQDAEAAEAYRLCTLDMPHNGEAYRFIGSCLGRVDDRVRRGGDRDRRVVDALRTAVRVEPGLADAHADLAYELAGHYVGAAGGLLTTRELLSHQRAALRLQPNDEDDRFNLALVRILSGVRFVRFSMLDGTSFMIAHRQNWWDTLALLRGGRPMTGCCG
jgi:tetratricopeptide (TPR) repeat protein